MDRKLSEFFPFSAESNLCASFILCIDDDAFSGSCAFHELLFKLLKDGKNVHIISAAHGRSHYEAVLRKQALDLRQLEQGGRVTLQFPVVSYPCTDSYSTETEAGTCGWRDLLRWQTDGMPFCPSSSSFSGGNNNDDDDEYALCIDDLEAIEAIAPTAQAARSFVSLILMRMSSISTPEGELRAHHKISTVVAYGRQNPHSESSSKQSTTHSGITSFSHGYGENIFFPNCLQGALFSRTATAAGGFEPMLSEYLRYRADAVVRIQPLTSGYSSEVHGIISVTVNSSLQGSRTTSTNASVVSKRDSGRNATNTDVLMLHYKALDTGIRCTLSNR